MSLKESLKGNLQNADLAEHIKQFKKVNVIPVAHLDFGMSPRDDVRPQEVFSALLKLRRDLAGHGLRFPLYDFASVWYLHKTDHLKNDRLRNLLPNEALDLAAGIVDLITIMPVGSLAKPGFLFLASIHESASLFICSEGSWTKGK